ncbi:hypothetical protein [Variovorax sp. JS1663]|uniref:hypothetical protein n=1 Tax=Variovorax sp. JS1663 TaxID=1851577 RepID=UPI00117D1ECB|nr:hypothetical protein [Variovorax sp. JS1663]
MKRLLICWLSCQAFFPIFAQEEVLQKATESEKKVLASTPPEIAAQKFLRAVHELEMEADSEAQIKEKIKKVIQELGWDIESFALSRFEINRGMTTNVRIDIKTSNYCIKNKIWIDLSGKPFGLNLAQPFRYVNISTPEAVDRLVGAHVVVLHYRLNENYRYSLESDEESGCFFRLTIE